jgi:two-component system, OmpR family, response regulator RegX3
VRIVLAFSNDMVAKIITVILHEASHDVTDTRTAGHALKAISETETDAVILDAELPDMDGFQLCKEIRAIPFSGPIVFVTRRSALDDKLVAFHNGADDYIITPFEPEELLVRVEASARRCRHLDQQSMGTVVKVGDAELSIGDLSFKSAGHPDVTLTPTEMRLLERLMRNAGITISRETLIERTWGCDYFGDSNRVDVYIARLRKKIEPDPSHPTHLHTVRGLGYVFRAPENGKPQTNGQLGDLSLVGHRETADLDGRPVCRSQLSL